MLRPDASPSQHAFPYDRSLFSEPLQGVFSILSQILRLEDDSKVTEIMVGIICLISQASKEVNLQFDQYLADKIAYQLGHFQSGGKVFRYQTLLMLMVITENLTELRQLEPVHFSDNTDLSQRHASLSFFTFSGTVIPALYRLIFGVTNAENRRGVKSIFAESTSTSWRLVSFRRLHIIENLWFRRGDPSDSLNSSARDCLPSNS